MTRRQVARYVRRVGAWWDSRRVRPWQAVLAFEWRYGVKIRYERPIILEPAWEFGTVPLVARQLNGSAVARGVLDSRVPPAGP